VSAKSALRVIRASMVLVDDARVERAARAIDDRFGPGLGG
jgi:hypothetical protein